VSGGVFAQGERAAGAKVQRDGIQVEERIQRVIVYFDEDLRN
jgi:hypothetical protein